MSEFHDSNYYKRQRIIGRWAFQLLIKLFACEMLLYTFVRVWEQNPIWGMVPSKVTMPYCYLGIGAFIVIFAFVKLTKELEEFDAAVLKQKEQATPRETPTKGGAKLRQIIPNKSISVFPELLQAIEDKQITQDGTLRVPRSEFVLYCHDHDFFGPRNKESGWKPIDGLLKDSRHRKPLIAKQFRQSYQDLGRDGKVPID